MTFSHWMIGSYFWYNDRKWPYVILHRRINGHCLKWTFTLNQVSNWILLISLISSINIQLYHMPQSHDLTTIYILWQAKLLGAACISVLVLVSCSMKRILIDGQSLRKNNSVYTCTFFYSNYIICYILHISCCTAKFKSMFRTVHTTV